MNLVKDGRHWWKSWLEVVTNIIPGQVHLFGIPHGPGIQLSSTCNRILDTLPKITTKNRDLY